MLTAEGRSISDAAVEDMAPLSFAHSILLDLLRRSNNDLQNYSGNTSLPLLLIALARVVIALLSLLLSICGIIIHVLLAVTIRILVVVVDGVSFVQRIMWRVVERVVTKIAIRMEWQQRNRSRNHDSHRRDHHYHQQGNGTSTDDAEQPQRGRRWRIFGLLEPYRKYVLHQFSLIMPPATTRNKLDTLPDIMNNTPPSLSLFALVTALAFIVHPDGLTWIVLGKLCEGVLYGLRLLKVAATAIVAAMLSSSYQEGIQNGGSSIGCEILSTIVASAVLASLIMLGRVMYRALYKKNTTIIDPRTTSSSSSSNSKKKKGRRGRNSGRHGNNHNRYRNNRKDAQSDISTATSKVDATSLTTHQHKRQHTIRSQSRSLSPTRTNSVSTFTDGKDVGNDVNQQPKVTEDDNVQISSKGSKETRIRTKDAPKIDSSNKIDAGKSSTVQQLPHDPAQVILSNLRPDSTDSLSVPPLLAEDASAGSSAAGSLVVDCGLKQGGGATNRANVGNCNNNLNAKKRGGARGGKHYSNGAVRTPPGFVSSSKSSSMTRRRGGNPRTTSGRNNPSSHERHCDERKQRQSHYSKKKSRDMNHQHQTTRTRASTSDCVIREHEVHSSPVLNNNYGTKTNGTVVSPTPTLVPSVQNRLHQEQRVRVASANELPSLYRASNQISTESSLFNKDTSVSNRGSPVSPPSIRPPPGLGFGSPVGMNSFGHTVGVGGVELATTASNHRVSGPTLSLSSPQKPLPQPQSQRYSSYDQSNFFLQPSVFPSISNANDRMKESQTNEDERIDADLQELGDQMVGSVLDF